MDRQRLDGWCEKGILSLAVCVLVFGPLATGAVRTLEFLVLQGLTLAAMALWGARIWLNPSCRILWPPVCWAVILFAGYAIWRYSEADIEYVAREELIRILVYSFLFLVILNNLHRQDSVHFIVYVLVFLAMGISLYTIYQFITGSNMVWHFIRPAQYDKRGSGTYICPNHLAGFVEMILPLGLTFTLMGRLNHVMKVFLGYASLIILGGIGVSVSRGGWIATGLALIVLFAFLLRQREYTPFGPDLSDSPDDSGRPLCGEGRAFPDTLPRDVCGRKAGEHSFSALATGA